MKGLVSGLSGERVEVCGTRWRKLVLDAAACIHMPVPETPLSQWGRKKMRKARHNAAPPEDGDGNTDTVRLHEVEK